METAVSEDRGNIENIGRRRKKLTPQEKWQVFLEILGLDKKLIMVYIW